MPILVRTALIKREKEKQTDYLNNYLTSQSYKSLDNTFNHSVLNIFCEAWRRGIPTQNLAEYYPRFQTKQTSF